MQEERVYPVDKFLMLNTIWDMAELQCAKKTTGDVLGGQVSYTTTMYGIEHEYQFLVTERGDGCVVRIEIEDGTKLISSAFALLESLMEGHQKNSVIQEE